MSHKSIMMNSTEISTLWTMYQHITMSTCMTSHLLQHLKETDIRLLVERLHETNKSYSKQLFELFQSEQFPVPKGFSDEDVNNSAPALFTDLFGLSYVYVTSKISLITYSHLLVTAIRQDIVDLVTQNISDSVQLYQDSTHLMLEKGIYDRPPKIPYPETIQLEEKTNLLDNLFGDKRPLNCLELSQIFFNIEKICTVCC